jgi:hypothetical protein
MRRGASQEMGENAMSEDVLSPVDLKEKVEELRLLMVERIAALEEEPSWGTVEEREELAQSLDELVVQGEALSEVLMDLT